MTPPEKIIKVESTFHAVRDEHVKTIMHFRKMTGSSKQDETPVTAAGG